MEDKPTVPDLIRWLRERAEINRKYLHIPPQQWEVGVLPFIASRLDQAASELERQEYIMENFRNLDDIATIDELRREVAHLRETCEKFGVVPAKVPS